MSMGNDHKSSADALSAILGPGGNEDLTTDPMDAERTGATDATAAADHVDLADDDLSSDGAEAALELVDDIAATEPVAARRPRRTRGAPKLEKGGRWSRLLGLVCLCGGITTTILDGQGKLPPQLAEWGYDSSILLAIGTVAYVIGVMRRQVALSQVRIDAISFQQQEAQLDMQGNLQYLVEQHQVHAERPPAQGEELDRVLNVLQRQDEKVNNLSRALKMYGKPLMEIANQGADVAAQVNQLKGHVEAVLGAIQQGFTRIESAARNQTIDLGPIEQQTTQTAEDLKRTLVAFGERLPNAQAMQQLQQQLVRVEASVQATSQRLDDSEVRKSLVRLEDTSKLHGKKLDEVARSETMHAETKKIEHQLDTAIGKLNHTVEQVRSKNLGALETTVRDIQRELSGLATSIAYIQQAVRTGVRVGAPVQTGGAPGTAQAHAPSHAPSPASAPAPAVAAPASTATHTSTNTAPTRPTTSSDVAAKPAASTVDTTGLNDAQAGVAQNQTGTRATASKNVLGAIAKLKKLKS